MGVILLVAEGPMRKRAAVQGRLFALMRALRVYAARMHHWCPGQDKYLNQFGAWCTFTFKALQYVKSCSLLSHELILRNLARHFLFDWATTPIGNQTRDLQ